VVFKHILIAVPTMGGLIKAKTTTTLVLLMRQLTRAGVAAEYLNIDSSDIVYARNYYAAAVLKSEVLDGLLFVDSDMQFRPLLVMKMLRLEADVVAAAYPKRSLNLDQLARALIKADSHSPAATVKALANVYQYTVVPSWESPRGVKLSLKAGFAKMAAAGMGCTLISRAALQAMIDGGAVDRRKDIINGKEELSWGFFDNLKVGDITLSEDFSFCYRWTRTLGRDLWVNVDEEITHLGDFGHRARYIDRLAIVATPAAADLPEPSAPESTAIDLDAELIVDAES
jgi:hypothetical protein